MSVETKRLSHNHLTSIDQLSADWFKNCFLPRSRQLADYWQNFSDKPLDDLSGKKAFYIFLEPSLRTKSSFLEAARMLSLYVEAPDDPKKSLSLAKGESLIDTVRVLSRLKFETVVIRSPKVGEPQLLADQDIMPIISGGDGSGQHVSQGLQDGKVICDQFGDDPKGLTVVFTGDTRNSRVMKSEFRLFNKLKMNMIFAAPPKLSLTRDVKDYLEQNNIPYRQVKTLKEVANYADVTVLFRFQAERELWSHSLPQSLAKIIGKLLIDPRTVSITDEIMETVEQDRKRIVLHALPRKDKLNIINELPEEFTYHPQILAFTKQIDAGVPTRMYLLKRSFNQVD